MKVNAFTKAAVAAGGVTLVALAAVSSPAQADPDPLPPPYADLAVVGSDTTQHVMNGFGALLQNGSGGNVIDSWDATPPAHNNSTEITSKDPAVNSNCEDFVRPNGSSSGRNALIASEDGTPWQGQVITDCVDVARSSAGPRSTGTDYTYLPLGVDAVTVAVEDVSFLPTNVTFVQIQRIYQCLEDDIAGEPVTPVLIQPGSGTRQFWLSQMDITEADIENGFFPCLVAEDENGDEFQEHDGRPLENNDDYLMPFSIGQWIAQSNRDEILTQTGVQVEDRRGPARLLSIGGEQPVVNDVLNINFPVVRDIYNVVPTTDLSDPRIDDTFVGLDSLVCEEGTADDGVLEGREITQLFGFGFRDAPDGNGRACGATDLTGNS